MDAESPQVLPFIILSIAGPFGAVSDHACGWAGGQHAACGGINEIATPP
jgi:hypothetical protein